MNVFYLDYTFQLLCRVFYGKNEIHILKQEKVHRNADCMILMSFILLIHLDVFFFFLQNEIYNISRIFATLQQRKHINSKALWQKTNCPCCVLNLTNPHYVMR